MHQSYVEKKGEEVLKEEIKSDEKNENDKTLKPIICTVCNEEFDSRNKLFDHIKEKGHAAPKLVKPEPKAKKSKKPKK